MYVKEKREILGWENTDQQYSIMIKIIYNTIYMYAYVNHFQSNCPVNVIYGNSME